MDADQDWQELSPMKAAGRMTSLRIIDVREEDDYASALGHIVGSTNVPLSRLIDDAQGWERDAPLLLVCRYGHKSRVACQKLAAEGFGQLTNLEGGLLAWLGAGLPTS